MTPPTQYAGPQPSLSPAADAGTDGTLPVTPPTQYAGPPPSLSPAADAGTDGTLPFGWGMTPPRQYAGPSPSLSPTAYANHVTGVCIARCVITEEGAVEQCKVFKGLPYMDEHLVRTLEAQKYSPVIYQGKPQRVFYTFKITFK